MDQGSDSDAARTGQERRKSGQWIDKNGKGLELATFWTPTDLWLITTEQPYALLEEMVNSCEDS